MLESIINIEEQDFDDSLTIWGIGLCYEYDAASERISVIHGRHYQPIIDVDLDTCEEVNTSNLIHIIEKITEIQALMLSNNATCDITEIMSTKQLRSYLEHVIDLAHMAMRLESSDYQAFARMICAEFELENMTIDNLNKGYSCNDFFRLSIQTVRGNIASCEGFHLSNCLSMLSRKIISDLLIMETSHNFQTGAHRLLRLSSNLSILSLVLDKSFIPRRKIKHERLKKQIKIA